MGVTYELQRHHSSHGDKCTATKKTHVKKWSTDSFLMVRKKERLCKGVRSIVRCRSQPKYVGYQMIQLNVLKGRNSEAFRKLRA